MVVMLRQCCCCCSLKTGTIIIGVLTAIGGAAQIIVGIFVAAAFGGQHQDNRDVIIAVGIGCAVFGGITLFAAICIIVGAANGNPVLLIPWMGYYVLLMVLNITVSIVSVGYTENGVGNIVGAIICLLIQIYFLLVVFSLFRELKGTAPTDSA